MPNDFRQEFSRYNKSTAKQKNEISGLLGIYLNNQKYVDVSNRPGFVYVRLRNNLNEVIQAFNETVSPLYNLPVIVIRQGNRYIVKGRDTERYSNWNSPSPFLPAHANSHSFNPDGGGGGDIVWTYGKQIMPMAAFPSGTDGAGGVLVYPYQYKKTNGTVLNIGLTGTASMLPWKPTNDQAVMGIVYVDPNVGNPLFTFNTGTLFTASITGTEEVVPYYPSITNQSLLLIAGIRLVSGTSSIGWNNIYDLRQWITPAGTGTSSGGGGGGGTSYDGYGVAVLEEGIFIVSGTAVDFVDDGSVIVDVTASGTRARVYISGSAITDLSGYITGSWDLLNGAFAPTGTTGGGVDQIGLYFQDEGVPLGTGTVLNVVGANADISISGTVARLFITGSVGGGSAGTTYLGVYDDGVFLASGTELSFDTNLNLGVSGSIIHIESPITTYQMTGPASPLNTITGSVWQVPDKVYASGSLAVYYDGLIQYKGVDYEELIYVSGTYQYLFPVETGINHMVCYGVPCSAQTYVTGSISEFALTDSDAELLLDSDSEQLLDSDG